MTSPHDPSHHDDDTVDERDLLASRALDGDVERDGLTAEVLARVEDMDRVRTWMVDTPPVATSVTDVAVAAALAVAAQADDAPEPVARVVPLARRRLAPALPWLGAAAAAAALVVGVTAMNGGDDSIDVADKQDATTMEATGNSIGIEQRTSDTMTLAEGDVEFSASLPGDGGSVGGESAPAETVEPAQAPAEDTADPLVTATEAPSTGDVPLIADLAEIPRSEASLTTGALCAPDDALIVPAALLGTDLATAALVEVVIDTDGDLVAYSLGDCVEVERLPAG